MPPRRNATRRPSIGPRWSRWSHAGWRGGHGCWWGMEGMLVSTRTDVSVLWGDTRVALTVRCTVACVSQPCPSGQARTETQEGTAPAAPANPRRCPRAGVADRDGRLVWRSLQACAAAERDLPMVYAGSDPIPIRWVLVVDPTGRLRPAAFFSTDLALEPTKIVEWFVLRWGVEVTFEESRRHLGVETQRQWTALAIARSTPALFGLFSLVCVIACRLAAVSPVGVRVTAWYLKKDATFSDVLALVRRALWAGKSYPQSPWQDHTCYSAHRSGTSCSINLRLQPEMAKVEV